MDSMQKAYTLLDHWKRNTYIHGMGVFERIGELAKPYGNRALVVGNPATMNKLGERLLSGLYPVSVEFAEGAKPNTPKEDVYRIRDAILAQPIDMVIAVGGGSTIDAAKMAVALAALGASAVEPFFGTQLVTAALTRERKQLLPFVAVETCASSGSHLTKYANITDVATGQKKLVVDDALIPTASLFDYETTISMPLSVTVDGILDAFSHTFEVFCKQEGKTYELAKELMVCTLDLLLEYAPVLVKDGCNIQAREAVSLASDLGGYAIMIGGTSGAHMTSFSLVELVGHGTACGLLNPYYAVFYQKAIQKQLQVVHAVFASHALCTAEHKEGGELAIDTALEMMAFFRYLGAPVALNQIQGFSETYIEKAITAAKDPQLAMKLKNMPVSLDAERVEIYLRPLLRASATGDLSLIVEL